MRQHAQRGEHADSCRGQEEPIRKDRQRIHLVAAIEEARAGFRGKRHTKQCQQPDERDPARRATIADWQSSKRR